MKYDESRLRQFPVFSHMDDICDALKGSQGRCLVMTAETGAGKSTVFPIGLLDNFDGHIVMTEPRRLGVLGTANRISELLDEQCGDTCGYRIHLESRMSEKTRLEVVTEAVLVRMLQDDMALEKYNVVVLDEFHERSVSLDLISIFLKEALELRDDLFVVVMSATINARRIASYFNDAPVVEIPGRTFPVEIEYKPNVGIESAVIDAFSSVDDGNILVFLPGIYEIRKCVEKLRAHFGEDDAVEILILHSSISIEEQKNVLSPVSSGIRRIIVSSAIAETSLTVPGVTCVIDSGLCRMNIFNPTAGMEKLVTANESDFSADQRAGRAGRIQKGKCIRLWSRNDVRQKEILPEILRTELSTLVLECAERGMTDVDKLDFLDKPSKAFWNESVFLLEKTSMIKDGRITKKGRSALKLGMDIRLAGVVLAAKGNPELMEYARQLFNEYGNYSNVSDSMKKKAWDDVLHRLEKMSYEGQKEISDGSMLLLEGFADRLAMRLSAPGDKNAEYQFVSGRKAYLHYGVKTNGKWIVALEADAGTNCALIYRAEETGGTEFDSWLEANSTVKTESFFKDGKLCKEEQKILGRIVLSSRKMTPDAEDLLPAWKNEVSRKGLDVLPMDDNCRKFLLRVEYYRQQKNLEGTIYDLLSEKLEEWLGPFLNGVKRLDAKTVYDGLFWFFEGSEIDREVPAVLEFPNGRKFKVVYEKNEKIRPVVEVIIQRVFGCFATPTVMGKKVLLKLLSPASRPLQITDDLENFWTTSWPEICREMKGRYPKHNWDYRVVEN